MRGYEFEFLPERPFFKHHSFGSKHVIIGQENWKIFLITSLQRLPIDIQAEVSWEVQILWCGRRAYAYWRKILASDQAQKSSENIVNKFCYVHFFIILQTMFVQNKTHINIYYVNCRIKIEAKPNLQSKIYEQILNTLLSNLLQFLNKKIWNNQVYLFYFMKWGLEGL